MKSELRHKTVAVAVMYDDSKGRFLLAHNHRWHGYAFPMKKIGETSAEHAAVQACLEWDIRLPAGGPASVEPAGRMGDCHYSDAFREYTFYDYHLIRISLSDVDEASLHPDLRFFTFEELEDAVNVTHSSKMIADWLVGDRHVVEAIICRNSERGREFLLTHTPEHQYFFPTTRLRHDAYPAEEVARLVQLELGYEGDVEVANQTEVDALQESKRFGTRKTRFHFHLCLLNLPNVDLLSSGNALEQSLARVVDSMQDSQASAPAYWGWFTEEEMRTRPDMSPSMPLVLNSVIQLAERDE